MRTTAFLIAALWALTAAAATPSPIDAGYPIAAPLSATILGTPSKLRADLPTDIPVQTRTLPPLVERRVPAVLEYALPLEYTVTAQDGPAPLVFIIAGTGAGAHGTTSMLLTRILYAEGYHVVSLPSPTRVAFMLAAARHPPGRTTRDVAALYRMMRTIKQRVNDTLDITGFALTGYSLGGLHAAFIAYQDSKRQVFNFGPVLLINPAVNLYQSVRRMDALLARGLPGGIDSLPRLLAHALGKLKRIFSQDRPIKFNRDALFQAYHDAHIAPRQRAAIVGLAFRLWLANMSFAADLLTNSGVIVPPQRQLSITDSLEPYLRQSFAMSFTEYIDKLLLPYYNRGAHHLTREQLIREGKLQRIGHFLAQSRNIGVLTNADDPILGTDGLAFLRETFGDRATIFKNGGHLGNLAYKPVVAVIQRFFRQ